MSRELEPLSLKKKETKVVDISKKGIDRRLGLLDCD